MSRTVAPCIVSKWDHLSDVYDFLAAELRSRRHAFSKPLAGPAPSPFVCGSPHAYSRAVGSNTRHASGFPCGRAHHRSPASRLPPLGE